MLTFYFIVTKLAMHSFLGHPKLYFSCLHVPPHHHSILAERFVPILSVQVCWAEAALVDSEGTVQVGQVTHEAATKSMTDELVVVASGQTRTYR